MARPTKKTDALCESLCLHIAEGGTLREWCGLNGNPARQTIIRWLREDSEFRDQYARAREDQADYFAEEILAISDDDVDDWAVSERTGNPVVNETAIQRARLMVETRKWLMGKMRPKVYGEKKAVEHSGPDGGPIETKADLSGYSTEQLKQVKQILATPDSE